MSDSKSIRELAVDASADIRQVFTHREMIYTIKNQDPIIKQIFTHQNVRLLLSYLNREHEPDPAQMELSFKMPTSAMEILCCESHFLTELIFESEQIGQKAEKLSGPNLNSSSSLLDFLFEFFDHRQQYFLAGLFAKVVISLTKRVFSPAHKYNAVLCDRIFGNHAILMKTCNHLYTQSMNELIIRWLLLKTNSATFLQQKQQYLTHIFSLINLSEAQSPAFQMLNFGQECLDSVSGLVMLMLKPSWEAAPERPQLGQHKNSNVLTNKNSQKQLYELCCQDRYLSEIMRPIPKPRIQKMRVIQKIIRQYRAQNQYLEKLDEAGQQVHLSQIITQQMLVQCFEWVSELLASACEQAYSHKYSAQSSPDARDQQAEFRRNLSCITSYLTLLYQFHLVEELKEPLTFFYDRREKEHVDIIIKLLRLRNDIIQHCLSKIIMVVITKLNSPSFCTSLLHFGISEVIDEQGIREHVVPWAKIILQTNNQKQHIFQDEKEQAKWDHMAQIISDADNIVVGRFRIRSSNLATFYSLPKATQFYQKFLQEPIAIEFQEKLFPRKPKPAATQDGQLQIAKPNPGKSMQGSSCLLFFGKKMGGPVESRLPQVEFMDILGIDTIRQGYLNYDIDKIIQEIQQ